MSPLERELRALIAQNGPIGVDRYMALCLGHPVYGYYRTRDPLGRAGDFVTAPEVSQIFGELAGLWFADIWLRLGSPAPIRLIELGPGRGTAMADALRAMRLVPGLTGALDLHLVETSPVLRQVQRATLEHIDVPMSWHDSLAFVPEGFALVLANEFFDALPVRQFVCGERGWHERLLGFDAQDNLAFGLAPDPTPLTLPRARSGTIHEWGAQASETMAGLAGRLARQGGAALIIDYGYATHGSRDTLQAVRQHRFTDPLANPGEADLTVHVNFASLAFSARQAGAQTYGPVSQGAFLNALGIRQRATALAAKADAPTRAAIAAALERLTGTAAMGELFKVLAVTGPTPAGFQPAGFDTRPSDNGSCQTKSLQPEVP